jgi:hypothetical protein
MRTPDDTYPELLARIIQARIQGDEEAALAAVSEISFVPRNRDKERGPGRTVIAKIYARDHYQCRYCGERVILTPVMRLGSKLYPIQFPYHRTGKLTPPIRHSSQGRRRLIMSNPSPAGVIRWLRTIS